jgi:outer membrane protein assembly factor BamB
MNNSSCFLVSLLAACSPGLASAQDWAQFRGASAQGIGAAEDLPATFSAKNVRWRAALGEGLSSPVLWGSRLFLTREGSEDGVREIVCLDAGGGEELWVREFEFEPYRRHSFNSSASSTPAVDADGIYVAWGSGGDLYALALDHGGELRWRKRLGSYRAMHGSGSSPILHGGLLIVPNENEGDESFLVALDKDSGETRWKIARQSTKQRAAYSCPVVCRPEGAEPFVLFASSFHGLTAVAPGTGEVLWEVDPSFKTRCVASPCVSGDLVFLSAGTNGGGKGCAIVRMPGVGHEEPELLHRPRRNIPYVPCAIALDGRFYMFSDGGFATCLEAETGEVVWRKRLDGTFFSSPVSNGEVVFIADRDGILYSLAKGDRFELLGTFDLGEPVVATPAIARGVMYVRTSDHLICLGKPESGTRDRR